MNIANFNPDLPVKAVAQVSGGQQRVVSEDPGLNLEMGGRKKVSNHAHILISTKWVLSAAIHQSSRAEAFAS